MGRVYGYFGITDKTAIATITTQFRDVFLTLIPKNHLNQHMSVFFLSMNHLQGQFSILFAMSVCFFVCVSVCTMANKSTSRWIGDFWLKGLLLILTGPICAEPLLHSPWKACSHYYEINITLQHFFYYLITKLTKITAIPTINKQRMDFFCTPELSPDPKFQSVQETSPPPTKNKQIFSRLFSKI